MAEFKRSGAGMKSGLVWAIKDMFTSTNFGIAMIAAIISYILFGFFRKNL
jgi:hypothetical protein